MGILAIKLSFMGYPLVVFLLFLAESSAFGPSLRVHRAPLFQSSATIERATEAEGTTENSWEAPWQVHKFGGASLATEKLYRTVGDLLLDERDDTVPTMAVVSAKMGMTDLLVQVVDSALTNFTKAQIALEQAVLSQLEVLDALAPPELTATIRENIQTDAADISSIIQSLQLLQTVPPVAMEVVTGYGEIWSAQTLYAYLKSRLPEVSWLDAREVLVVQSDDSGLGEKGSPTGAVTPLWDETKKEWDNWWENDQQDGKSSPPLVVVTGFVARTLEGVPTTLKRSGSDYSATIFAKLLDAGRVTMWKNTNGVYTADPRRVPEAFPIASLKYDEAMELAYFGAQVLHPAAMDPVVDAQIPVLVRNIFNPQFEGTIIQGRCKSLKDTSEDVVKNWKSAKDEIPIKGITSIDKIALVSLEGCATMGSASVARKFLGAMADADVTVLIITQASSESSITIAVPESQGALALQAVEQALELELARSTVNSASMTLGMSIVAIVGEGMALKSGVSATFMRSLAMANVNIRLIAQGSSERQIAVVVQEKDTSRALRASHMAFTLSETEASISVLGSTGQIGSALLNQFSNQKQSLAQDMDISLCLKAAASSTKMVLGIDSCFDDPRAALEDEESSKPIDLDKLTKWIQADVNPFRIVVDCTNSEEIADYYEKWLQLGVHIVSPGRKLGSGSMERYQRVSQAQKDNTGLWLLESSVGSALPIIGTLRDLVETGDKIISLQGSLSGTMAYVLSTVSSEVPFSQAVRQAVEKGYTENDIKEDLSGHDMASKVVILARCLGLETKLDDVEIESLLTDDIVDQSYQSNEALLDSLQSLDGQMEEKRKAAEDTGERLRYKFEIDTATGRCSCKLESVGGTDPLYRLKRNENLVAFETSRYVSSPLIVKGAAAGPELAAAGVFADILRLARAYSSSH